MEKRVGAADRLLNRKQNAHLANVAKCAFELCGHTRGQTRSNPRKLRSCSEAWGPAGAHRHCSRENRNVPRTARPTRLRDKWRIRWLAHDGERCSAVYDSYREADHQLRLKQAEAEDVRRGLRNAVLAT
jgi:hypothetical protein